jgi:hypothetical protein
MKYADCLTNSGELFKFLYKNEIGTGLAVFWIAWAWVAEYTGDFPLADKVCILYFLNTKICNTTYSQKNKYSAHVLLRLTRCFCTP